MSDDNVEVQVWGPPESGQFEADQRACNAPDAGERVVFHCQPKDFSNGSHMCLACGSIYWPKGKGQQDRGKPV